MSLAPMVAALVGLLSMVQFAYAVTCDCDAYAARTCRILTPNAGTDPQTCAETFHPCGGCFCQTGAPFTCEIISSTHYRYIIPKPECEIVTEDFARCPTNVFVVTCGESNEYPDSFVCTLPTSTIQSSFSISCQMQITWNSNFTATFTNTNTEPQTADITVYEIHNMFINGTSQSQNFYFSLTSGSVDWNDDISATAPCVNVGFLESCQVSNIRTQTTSTYESTNDFSTDVATTSSFGTLDVDLRFQYQASGTAVGFDQSRTSAYTDNRVLVCEYIKAGR